LACNRIPDDEWLDDERYRLLVELGDTMYDGVAFYKHRAEGEICNIFAYCGEDLRIQTYRTCRELLWALDTTHARTRSGRYIAGFIRHLGGPIHMMMRRYRFIEDDMMIGRPENAQVVDETRHNVKLWYRIEGTHQTAPNLERYQAVLDDSARLLFPGMKEMLARSLEERCGDCRRRSFYAAKAMGEFAGVELCERCRFTWREYLLGFRDRAEQGLLSPAR
jgi:hypothetical protein